MNPLNIDRSFLSPPFSYISDDRSSTFTAPPITNSIQAQAIKKVTDRYFEEAILNISSQQATPQITPLSTQQIQKRGNHILGTTLAMIEDALLSASPWELKNELLQIKEDLLIWKHKFCHNLPILSDENEAASQHSSQELTSLPPLQSELIQNPLIKKGSSIMELLISSLTFSINSKSFPSAKKNLENTKDILIELKKKFNNNTPFLSPDLPPLRSSPISSLRSSPMSSLRSSPVLPLKPSKRQYSILLAEDTPLVARLTMRLLTGLGYNVYLFEDGEKALTELLNPQRPYHIALLDIQMPFLNGDDVVVQFKQRGEESRKSGDTADLKKFNVPCIAYTSNPEYAEQYMGKGMLHVLEKPAKAAILNTIITRYAVDDSEVSENYGAAPPPCMNG